jgi:ribosomal protein L32E
MKLKFLRRNTGDYSRLGKKRKKLQKWRAPKGRDNKMRLRRKSYPKTVEIGYKQDLKTRNKIDGKEIVRIENLEELKDIGQNKLIILGKIGKKKKLEIAKFVKEKGIEIKNLDIEKFILENDKNKKEKVEKSQDKKELKQEVKNESK